MLIIHVYYCMQAEAKMKIYEEKNSIQSSNLTVRG